MIPLYAHGLGEQHHSGFPHSHGNAGCWTSQNHYQKVNEYHVGQDVEKSESLCAVRGTVGIIKKNLEVPQNAKNMSYDPEIPLLGIYLKKSKNTNPKTYMHPYFQHYIH